MSEPAGEDAIYARLAALHPKAIDLSLGRLHVLLDKLGNPERSLPPVIHIAGTNGKGSTGAFCRAFLEAAGKTVHAYTSPHLVRFNERIRLAGDIVDDARLSDALEHVERINDTAPITFFEITTAAAFHLFAKTPADFLILEVGLGGTLDATNVVAQPVLTIITPISLDHQEYLGTTLAEIAAEKAGILKPHTPCIVGPQEDEAFAAIEKRAAQVRADLFTIGEAWMANEENGRLIFQDENGLLDLPAPKLAGHHQFENAGAAIAAMRLLPDAVDIAALEDGLKSVSWPARMQRLLLGDLVTKAPPKAEVWLDGGHNPAAGEIIAQHMATLEEKSPRPLIVIVGMLNTKDAAEFMKHFQGLALKVLTVEIPNEKNSISADRLAKYAARAGLDAAPMPDVATALAASGALDKSPRILICGSLYLAGHVLRLNGTQLT